MKNKEKESMDISDLVHSTKSPVHLLSSPTIDVVDLAHSDDSSVQYVLDNTKHGVSV